MCCKRRLGGFGGAAACADPAANGALDRLLGLPQRGRAQPLALRRGDLPRPRARPEGVVAAAARRFLRRRRPLQAAQRAQEQ